MLNQAPDETSVTPGPARISSAIENLLPFLFSKRLVEEKDTVAHDYEAGATAPKWNLGEKVRLIPGAVHFKPVDPVRDLLVPLQSWEGSVIEVLQDSFVARLIDRSSESPGEEAEFPLDEVSWDDRHLVKEGAVFYWIIGYRDSVGGQRTRISEIRFRRTATWTPSDFKRARGRARRLLDLLGW